MSTDTFLNGSFIPPHTILYELSDGFMNFSGHLSIASSKLLMSYHRNFGHSLCFWLDLWKLNLLCFHKSSNHFIVWNHSKHGNLFGLLPAFDPMKLTIRNLNLDLSARTPKLLKIIHIVSLKLPYIVEHWWRELELEVVSEKYCHE